MPDHEPRAWLKEAVDILGGKTQLMRVVQKEHLAAMAKELETLIANNQTLSEVVSALLLVAAEERLYIRAERLMEVRGRKTVLVVTKLPDGGVVIRARQTKPPIVEPTAGQRQM